MKLIVENYTEVNPNKKDCEVVKVSELKGLAKTSIYFRYENVSGKIKCL